MMSTQLLILLCLAPHLICAMGSFLPTGASIGREFGESLERSCRVLAQGFQNGTTLTIDDETRTTLDNLAYATITVSPATVNSASALTKQAGFAIAGTGAMLGGCYSLLSWATRYLGKTTSTTYGDYALGALSFTTLCAGAALVYHSDTLSARLQIGKAKAFKHVGTQTKTILKGRSIKRRHSL